mmetsp:Transcript_11153/g.24616  ORF Transcript_11153/g.24616 Transcript_11153/m.24616 type:complete len:112 (-) Transcript_11153:863-1198(-)
MFLCEASVSREGKRRESRAEFGPEAVTVARWGGTRVMGEAQAQAPCPARLKTGELVGADRGLQVAVEGAATNVVAGVVEGQMERAVALSPATAGASRSAALMTVRDGKHGG